MEGLFVICGKGLFSKTVIRKVIVEDLEKPKLSVNNDDMYVCPGNKVKAEKVTATDNYDGDLTSKIKVKVSEDKVVYKVTDSSGNSKEVVKKVQYKDIEKPVVTLNGNKDSGECLFKYINPKERHCKKIKVLSIRTCDC